ncbi:MAG TPA: FecR domain-containing protein [Gallionella sp.]|nr:FecR domain-containing protein [Gallionella sp.]
MRVIFAVLLLLVAAPIHAAPDVIVQGIQMPAWLQRGSYTQPLSAGMELHDGDKLTTGANARVLLHAADGSSIKLGENASLTLSGLAQQREGKGLFSALLDVAKGAFRFTTATIAKLRPRDVTVRVAGATVGIRGTDVWGKVGGKMSIAAMEKAMGKSLADADKEAKMDFDVVCLIEGRISVAHGSEAPFVMDQPQTFYVMRKDAPPLPVAGLASEQLAKWAGETEIAAGQGAVRAGGKWKVRLLTANSEREAMAAFDELRTAGYDARIRPLPGGQFQLRITHLPSRAEAQALAGKLAGKMGVTSPTVGR